MKHFPSMNPESITVSEATELAKTSGDLRLDSLKSLSKEVALALSRHSGTNPLTGRGVLSLSGLQTLSLPAARALQSYVGDLSLGGLTDISVDLATALAGHSGHLYLKGVSVLQPDAAKELAKRNGYLGLSGLTALSEETAEALSMHKGVLSLKGIQSLTPDSARHLAKHGGTLNLGGITSMSAEVAKSFEAFAGLRLDLSGLLEFPDPVVESLAKILAGGRLTVSQEGQDRIGEKFLADGEKAGAKKSETGDFDAKVFAIAMKDLPKLSQFRDSERIKNFLKRPKNLFVGIIEALRGGDSQGVFEKLNDDDMVASIVVHDIGRELYVLKDLLTCIDHYEDLIKKDREYARNFLKKRTPNSVCSNMEKGIKLLKLKDKSGKKKVKGKKAVRTN